MTGAFNEPELSVIGIGVDFGTSNSVIGLLRSDGNVVCATFSDRGELVTTLPSLLCLSPSENPTLYTARRVAGFAAIEEYLLDPSRSRLFQSLKTYLGSRSFDRTQVGAESFDLQQLIAAFLEGLFEQAALVSHSIRVPVVCGRPVRFAGVDPDDAMAEARLREAYALIGLRPQAIRTEAEAAAYTYSRMSNGSHFALIADLGGGTSDFSVVRISGEGSSRTIEPLSQTGIGVAGDTFDSRIVQHMIAPTLGLSGKYRPQDKWLPMPNWIAGELTKRHRIASLRTPKVLRQLRDIGSNCDEPAAFAGLIHIVKSGLGYKLFAAISALKTSLSSADRATLSFHDGPVHIEREVSRAEFEKWICADLDALEEAVDGALLQAGIEATQISAAFLTGGSSLIPHIQDRFKSRFVKAEFVSSDNFASVAHGLALMSAGYASPRDD